MRFGWNPQQLFETVLRIVRILPAALCGLLRVGELDLKEARKRRFRACAREEILDLRCDLLVGIGAVLGAKCIEITGFNLQRHIEHGVRDIRGRNASPQICLANLTPDNSADIDRH